jgi:hypothetical protein
MPDRKDILEVVDEAVEDFVLFDRREDDVIGVNAIEDAIYDGKISIDDIVERFADRLRESIRH